MHPTVSKVNFNNFTSTDSASTQNGWHSINETGTRVEATLDVHDIHFVVGTASTQTLTAQLGGTFGGTAYASKTQTYTVAYDGDTTVTFTIIPDAPTNVTNVSGIISTGKWYIDSTVSTISDFLYIDLDIGEAYMFDANNKIVSLNDRAEIPARLPALVPGANTITVEGAINELVIIPRWWEV